MVRDPEGSVVQKKTIDAEAVIDVYMRISKRGVYSMCFTAVTAAEGPVRVSFSVAYKNRKAGSGRLKFKNDGGAGDPSKKVLKEVTHASLCLHSLSLSVSVSLSRFLSMD
mgnify:CR=1 FL=1